MAQLIAPSSSEEVGLWAVAKASGQFLGRLYPLLVEANGPDKNLAMSPLSLSTVLSMTLAGCRERTAEELKAALGFSEADEATLHQGQRALADFMHGQGTDVTLSLANKLYVGTSAPIREDFLTHCGDHYRAGAEAVDFGDGDQARGSINRWVERHTKLQIRDLIPQGVLNALTRLVLVNAVYFKGNWLRRFSKSKTKTAKFRLAGGGQVKVQMMHQKDVFPAAFVPALNCTALQLGYKGDAVSMLVFLPDRADQFDAMDRAFATLDLASLRFDRHNFKVAIPRFKVETSHELVRPLQACGVQDLFDQNRADLSGIDGGAESLFVSLILQKASVEVNEEGSEAAAASAVVVHTKSLGRKPKATVREFVCDRPFLFVIRENRAGVTLFNGRIMNPCE